MLNKYEWRETQFYTWEGGLHKVEFIFLELSKFRLLTLTINYTRGEMWIGEELTQEQFFDIPLEILTDFHVYPYIKKPF